MPLIRINAICSVVFWKGRRDFYIPKQKTSDRNQCFRELHLQPLKMCILEITSLPTTFRHLMCPAVLGNQAKVQCQVSQDYDLVVIYGGKYSLRQKKNKSLDAKQTQYQGSD